MSTLFPEKGENNLALDHKQSTKFSIDFNPHRRKSGDLMSGSLVIVGTTEYQEKNSTYFECDWSIVL